MTTQKDPNAPLQDPQGAIVNQQVNQQAMSMVNHASLQTSTADAANILVVKHEALVKRSIASLRGGRTRAVTALNDANEVLAKSITAIGTAINKHNHGTFKALLKDFNATDNSDAFTNFKALFGTTNNDVKGEFTCVTHFDSSDDEFTIELSASLKVSRVKNIAEDSVEPTTLTLPIPHEIRFTNDQISDVMASHPVYFPEKMPVLAATVIKNRATAAAARTTIQNIDAELSRLNGVLGEIPTLERAARAKITESQLRNAGMENFVKDMTEDNDEMISDLIGDYQSDFVNESGQFKLPVANQA